MARFPTFIAAVLVSATALAAQPAVARQDDGQRPAPRPSGPQQQAQPRHPPAQQPAQPPHAVPRPPASTRPHVAPGARDWIYPIYPPLTFDLIYGFPYGLYPYWTYGNPWGASLSYAPPIEGCPPEETASAARAGLRIDVAPPEASVFVDGYYVGLVEDFASDEPPLQLEAGPHRIEIRLAGFETLTFFVNPEAGQTITYRGALQPVRP